MEMKELLLLMVNKEASDLHITVQSPPVLRINGELTPIANLPSLTAEDIEHYLAQVANEEQRAFFAKNQELDFAYSIPGLARFRVNVMQQRGVMSIVCRLVPFYIPSIDELGLPQILKDLIIKPRGLILVTGPTGSGKSTTMAAMLNHLNNTLGRNIITIEDPIEFLFRNKKCLIRQRDVGDDTQSFSSALIRVLRHDPDVIAVGEMRDIDTVSMALRAAETGHLVISTLHTNDVTQTVDRIIDIFPANQHTQIRVQFSQVLEAVLSQCLLPRIDGNGRIVAFEIMLATPAIRNLIRSEKTHELSNIISLGSKEGMQTMDQALAQLVKNRTVSLKEAMMKSSNPAKLQQSLQS